MRGISINQAMDWFDQQDIPHRDYLADFVPHELSALSTIFVVNRHGIYGEVYFGTHTALTQGFHEGKSPITFAYDFKHWKLSPANDDALAHVKSLAKLIHVTVAATQKEIATKLNASFSHDYLNGYFETTHFQSGVTWFIDYNRILGQQYSDFIITQDDSGQKGIVRGRTASAGKASGKVKIVSSVKESDFAEGDILVCAMTSPDYLPLMKKAAAIVTDQGGILCHAAIVARELKKPCLVGTSNATQVLRDGQRVTVDATNGIISAQ